MGMVDVCTILRDNSEAEGRCDGGPITLDMTKWDFNEADCRTKCRKLIRKFETAVADWITDRFWRRQGTGTGCSALGIHLRAVRNPTALGSVFPSRTLTVCRQLGTVNSCGFRKHVSRHVSDSD